MFYQQNTRFYRAAAIRALARGTRDKGDGGMYRADRALSREGRSRDHFLAVSRAFVGIARARGEMPRVEPEYSSYSLV
jgi:hypothetical protein